MKTKIMVLCTYHDVEEVAVLVVIEMPRSLVHRHGEGEQVSQAGFLSGFNQSPTGTKLLKQLDFSKTSTSYLFFSLRTFYLLTVFFLKRTHFFLFSLFLEFLFNLLLVS